MKFKLSTVINLCCIFTIFLLIFLGYYLLNLKIEKNSCFLNNNL
jgi:TRAP-type C4-dicarboxylate transport system permease small subunit